MEISYSNTIGTIIGFVLLFVIIKMIYNIKKDPKNFININNKKTMKIKYSIIIFILRILMIILAISVLIFSNYGNVILLYILICLEVFQIFNGLYFYKQDKKSDGMIAILSSIFILGVVIRILFFL